MTSNSELLARREKLLGPNVRVFYDEPVQLVRGLGVWVYDADGRKYLDCYNNVPHVGHCHPHVIEAICKQAATLNTHTRYLHEGILNYVERLTATFADNITSAIMVCTGSEANDVALRMAQAVTGKIGIIATNHTYHGNTSAVSQLSTTKPPIGGFSGHVRHVSAPDSYRPTGGDSVSHAKTFADEVEQACQSLITSGHGVSGMIICPTFVNEGFPDLHAGFLDRAIAAVRKAGGLIISDEVQPGFGRTGTHFWGHQKAGFTPDIATMGKPMGNGHPVAAVATSLEIMSAFRNAFGYFNTFGGNPVSCAAANAVMDVIEGENLQTRARETGDYARAGLKKLAEKHNIIGDVRGSGLAIGVELVLDRLSKKPAKAEADRVINLMRQHGVLMGTNGMGYNVLKMRPPMAFGKPEADVLLAALDTCLQAL
jgi:4-aminobutyrate aminotransferase-like enzyme